METSPIFFVSFEKGRWGADGAAASAFGFPEGAAGSSFSRTCFLLLKKQKINGEDDGRAVRSAGSKLYPGVRRARVPCVLLISAGRWFSLGRAPCGVSCFSKVNELSAWGERQGRKNKPQPAARRLTGACPRREKAERSGRLALSLVGLSLVKRKKKKQPNLSVASRRGGGQRHRRDDVFGEADLLLRGEVSPRGRVAVGDSFAVRRDRARGGVAAQLLDLGLRCWRRARLRVQMARYAQGLVCVVS